MKTFLRARSGQLAIALVATVLGMMLAFQFRVQQRISKDIPYQRAEVLATTLSQVQKERDKLRDELDTLRSQVAKGSGDPGLTKPLEDQLKATRLVAGLVDVKGPGVIVTLDDSKRPRQQNEDPNVFLLHDDDLLKVVNELRAAGAEAISVNGQRLIGTSEIRCAGPTVSINNTQTAPPVEIRAIGDPQTLESALKLRGGVIESLSFWGIQVQIKKQDSVLVPAYKGSLKFTFAQPTEKEAGR